MRHLITSHFTGNIKAREFRMGRDDQWAEGRNHQRQIKLCCPGQALQWWSDIAYCHCCQWSNMVISSAGTLLQASPRNLAVSHGEVVAEQGHAISSAIYPLAVSGAQKRCPTSFTHLSRQKNGTEGDGNSGLCTRIVNLLKEKERSRLVSEKAHLNRFFPPYGLYSPPGFSVHGILQARIPECVVMLSSRGSSWLRDQTHISHFSCLGRQVLYH